METKERRKGSLWPWVRRGTAFYAAEPPGHRPGIDRDPRIVLSMASSVFAEEDANTVELALAAMKRESD